MVRVLPLLVLVALALAFAERLGLGRELTPEELRAYDVTPVVLPDGRGLPEGEGDYATGFEIYAFECASCHGPNGEGAPFDRLVAAEPFSPELPPHRFAIGNYWPYATTLFDYIYRAMPFQEPHRLSADEVYALVAYLLVENGIVPEDFVASRETLPKVRMPARERLRIDPLTRELYPWVELP